MGEDGVQEKELLEEDKQSWDGEEIIQIPLREYQPWQVIRVYEMKILSVWRRI